MFVTEQKFISLLEALATINNDTGFLDADIGWNKWCTELARLDYFTVIFNSIGITSSL